MHVDVCKVQSVPLHNLQLCLLIRNEFCNKETDLIGSLEVISYELVCAFDFSLQIEYFAWPVCFLKIDVIDEQSYL